MGEDPIDEVNHDLCKDEVLAAFPIEDDEAIVLAAYSDACGDIELVFNSEECTGDDCEWTLTRTWYVVDECGNGAADDDEPVLATYSHSGSDQTAPTFDTEPADQEVFATEDDCSQTVYIILPEVSDNCDDGINIFEDLVVSTDANVNFSPITFGVVPGAIPTPVWFVSGEFTQGMTTVTMTLTDACGNVATDTHVITVTDNTAPQLKTACPTSIVIGTDDGVCDAVYTFTHPQYEDNCQCSSSVISFCDENGDPVAGLDPIEYEGNSGNFAEVTLTYPKGITTVKIVSTDDSGNVNDECSFTVEVEDDEDPIFTYSNNQALLTSGGAACPAEVTTDLVVGDFPWDDSFTVAGITIAGPASTDFADNCPEMYLSVSSIDMSLIDPSDPNAVCSRTVTINWTATDCGGNTAGVEQIITIADDVAPVTPAAPADEAYQCVEDVPAPGDLTAVDACQGDITVTGVDADNGGAGCADDALVITRTWTFDDGCGNVSSVSQTITVIDDIAPEWDYGTQFDLEYSTEAGDQCPADANISLSVGDMITAFDTWTLGNITIPNLEPSVSDNCTALEDIVIEVTAITDNMDGCDRLITISFNATDECGNVSAAPDFESSYRFVDDTAPVAPEAPADEAYQCVEDVPAPGELTATDNCQPDITVTGVDTDNGGAGCAGDPLVITRTWTFNDGCDNITTISQTITVIDDISPLWDYATQLDAEYSTQAGDQCPADANISLSVGDMISPLDTWTLGNITIPNLGLSVSDNCTAVEDIVITVTEITDTEDGCNRLITISFNATDECGNVSAAPDFICSYRFVDDTNPVIEVEAEDAVVECDGAGNEAELAAWLESNGGAEASDNCQELSWTNDFEGLSDDCGATGAAIVTFTAHDGCGNSASTTATFTIEDTQAPEFITFPVDQVLLTVPTDCNQDAFIFVPEYGDACDAMDMNDISITADPFVNFGPLTLDINGNAFWNGDFQVGDTEVTLTITDDCGLSTSESLTITVIDNVDPVNVTACPEDQIGETDLDLCSTEMSWQNPFFDDNCDNVFIDVVFTSEDAEFVPENIDYPLNGGMGMTESALFAKGTTTVCYEVTDLAVHESGTSDDGTVFGAGANTATLCCFDIVIEDNQFPTAEDVEPSSYTCVEEVPAPDAEVVTTEMDNCPDLVVMFNAEDSSVEGSGCAGDPMVMTRIYDVIDCGENTIQVSHVITIMDDVAPTASNPELISVECLEEVPEPDVEVVTDEADNCSADIVVAWVADSEPVAGDDCVDGPVVQYTITREYSVTDCGGAGNSISVFQTIEVSDVTAPDAVCVETITVSLDENGEASITSDMIDGGSSDNCGELSVSIDVDMFTCDNLGDNTVTLSVEDENCNVSTCATIVTVIDEMDPVAECPAMAIVVELDGDGNGVLAENSVGDGSSTDNCGEVTETNPEQLYTCEDVGGEHTVELTATDASGNTNTTTCVVTVVDLLGPVATECQANIVELAVSESCVQQIDWLHPTFVDNCDGPIAYDESTLMVTTDNPTININYEVEGCEAVFPVGITTVTMSVMDSDGNIGSCIFTVEILAPEAAEASFEKEEDGLTVILTNTSTNATSYLWDFGDGNTSTEENPVHTYAASGSYDICLTAIGACDSESEMCMTVEVESAGIVELTQSFLIDGSTFTQGQSRDAVYVIDNIGSGTTTGPVQILITKTSTFAMAMDPAATTADVFGGISANNNDWDIIDLGGFYLCTMKAGMTIPAGGYSILCLNLEATGLPSSTAQTTGQLLDDTGGDVQKDNNFAQGSFIIN
jgi:PKD repeat protein